MNFADYAHDEVYASVDHFIDRNRALRDIDEAHCRALAQSFCHCTFDYACGLMIVYFTAAVNPAGSTYAL